MTAAAPRPGQLRICRVRAGKSAAQVAAHLQINPAWYADLERDDSALPATLTLFQASELAAFLDVRLHDLLGLPPARGEHIPVLDLPARIAAHLAHTGSSLADFENSIGHDLADLLRAPLQAAAELPLAFFIDLARALGIDWLALEPQSDAD